MWVLMFWRTFGDCFSKIVSTSILRPKEYLFCSKNSCFDLSDSIPKVLEALFFQFHCLLCSTGLVSAYLSSNPLTFSDCVYSPLKPS